MALATPFQLPSMPYDFHDLEPVISGAIMELHYLKHHQAYVTNLNKALEQYEEASQKGDLNRMAAQLSAIRFNGGGHLNHSLFWESLAPQRKGGGTPPKGPLNEAIERDFGSLQHLIDLLSAQTIAIQGSGWGWLGYDAKQRRLAIACCENQDPVSLKGLVPLFGIDVWEHAYYLQYKNVRADYVKAIWTIVNWEKVSQRFEEAVRS